MTRRFDGSCRSPSVAQTMDDLPAPEDVGRPDGPGRVDASCNVVSWQNKLHGYHYIGTQALGVFGKNLFTTIYFKIPSFLFSALGLLDVYRCFCMAGLRRMGKRIRGSTVRRFDGSSARIG